MVGESALCAAVRPDLLFFRFLGLGSPQFAAGPIRSRGLVGRLVRSGPGRRRPPVRFRRLVPRRPRSGASRAAQGILSQPVDILCGGDGFGAATRGFFMTRPSTASYDTELSPPFGGDDGVDLDGDEHRPTLSLNLCSAPGVRRIFIA